MIRYDYSLEQITAAVHAHDSKWLGKADERTRKINAQGKFEESSSIWSDVKSIYIGLQNRKCIFCERQFENAEIGTIEYDLEHFRPKSSVKAWPPERLGLNYGFGLGTASPNGYFWLAYHLSNYAASCKVCNSPLKSNFFPIAASRKKTTASIAALKAEKPFLCYPIGQIDDDPEKLVTFVATTAIPAQKTGHGNRRGQVMIDFFQLNKREHLHRERATFITLVGAALKEAERGEEKEENLKLAESLALPKSPHAACVRAFQNLWKSDKATARKIHVACRHYISMVGAPVPSLP